LQCQNKARCIKKFQLQLLKQGQDLTQDIRQVSKKCHASSVVESATAETLLPQIATVAAFLKNGSVSILERNKETFEFMHVAVTVSSMKLFNI
jgi:hypothetical protein